MPQNKRVVAKLKSRMAGKLSWTRRHQAWVGNILIKAARASEVTGIQPDKKLRTSKTSVSTFIQDGDDFNFM